MTRTLAAIGALFALALSSACGGGSTSGGNDSPDARSPGGGGPCEGPTPAPSCAEACTVDTDCDVGFHCASSACTAECTISGGQCGSGKICDRDGRCQTDTGPDNPLYDANCPDITVDTTQVIPSVQLVIDQSGSMNRDFGGVQRYDAVETALIDDTDGVVTALQDRVIFGATLYTSARTCPGLKSVPRALNNRDDIAALLAANGPANDTPTGESVQAVVNDFTRTPPPAGSPKVIVLATDGEPDLCSDGDANGRPASVAAAQAAFRAGITLYVLSVGTEIGTAHLQEVANAGVGRAPTDPNKAPFFVANNPTELSSKLQEIIGNIRSCSLTLDAELDAQTASQGTITLGSRTLVEGTDWELTDSTHITLKGTACQQLLTTADQVTATFPCGTVIDID